MSSDLEWAEDQRKHLIRLICVSVIAMLTLQNAPWGIYPQINNEIPQKYPHRDVASIVLHSTVKTRNPSICWGFDNSLGSGRMFYSKMMAVEGCPEQTALPARFLLSRD